MMDYTSQNAPQVIEIQNKVSNSFQTTSFMALFFSVSLSVSSSLSLYIMRGEMKCRYKYLKRSANEYWTSFRSVQGYGDTEMKHTESYTDSKDEECLTKDNRKKKHNVESKLT